MLIMRQGLVEHHAQRQITSPALRFLLTIAVGVILPGLLLVSRIGRGDYPLSGPATIYSLVGSTVALLLGLYLVDRVSAYPGTRAFSVVLPSLLGAYGLVLLTFFALRLDYSRVYFAASFGLTLVAFYVVHMGYHNRRQFFVVPNGRIDGLLAIDGVDWHIMTEPTLPAPSNAAIVADLRHDHTAPWERMLAEAALTGRPVYHSKQLRESLAGRVTIEHLSENEFGSLLPNLGYVNVKRAIDLIGALLLMPLLIVPLLVIGIIIRLDSPGDALFRQERMGYRGRPFIIYKFRTMRNRVVAQTSQAHRDDAMTKDDDTRVTRVGRILRRTRLDELPQILNIIRGEMSFIGPRPEAIALSRWYENELPFYLYRHIVLPGLSGWAQVNQGHVTDLNSVQQKLEFDFYYIKNFSWWLDLLIAFKTLYTVATGFGSR